jgi:hypothetical protein
MSTKRKTKTTEATALAERREAESQIAEQFGGPAYQIPTDAPLPRATIMRETQQFAMSGELVKFFEAHIIFWHETNTWWGRAFGEGDTTFPDCCSSNGVYPDGGEDRQSDRCANCEWNQYGSAPGGGRGKACQNSILLYLVRDGDRLPFVLKAPASSLGKRESLIPWLTNSVNEGLGGKYQTCRVRFSLYKKQFDQFSASVLKLETIRVLDAVKDKDELQRLSRLFAEVQKYYRKRGAQDVAASERDPAGHGDEIPI